VNDQRPALEPWTSSCLVASRHGNRRSLGLTLTDMTLEAGCRSPGVNAGFQSGSI
jgi:hypothetical protein